MAETRTLENALDEIAFGPDGLVPVVAQRHDSGEVLMLAWMNRAAVEQTLRTGSVCYWSRSRRRLWRKGESSGNTQRLVELRLDCDGDALVALVDQKGPACHTGRQRCFYRVQRDGQWATVLEPVASAQPEKGAD